MPGQADLFAGEDGSAGNEGAARGRRAARSPGAAVDPFGGLPPETRLYRLPVIALDFETTGLAARRGDAVCEVGLVAGIGDQTEVLLSALVNPERPLSAKTRELTGIDEKDLTGAPRLFDLMPEIWKLVGERPLVMHNAPFDLPFLLAAVEAADLPEPGNLAVDTLLMARFLDRSREGNSLRQAAERYGIARSREHRAADDARAAALVYHALIPYLELRGVRTVGDLVRGRMAGAAPVFVARPSSMLLDLAARAIAAETTVTLLYAVRPGVTPIRRRLRPRVLEGERYLSGWDPDLHEERTYRLDRILSLDDGRITYLSPWILPEEVPGRPRRDGEVSRGGHTREPTRRFIVKHWR